MDRENGWKEAYAGRHGCEESCGEEGCGLQEKATDRGE